MRTVAHHVATTLTGVILPLILDFLFFILDKHTCISLKTFKGTIKQKKTKNKKHPTKLYFYFFDQ